MKQEKKKASVNPQKARRKEASGFLLVGNNQQALISKFGFAVKAKREEIGMTQTELAKSAHLNRSYLSELENGLTSISLERAERLARSLNCTLRDMLS